VTGVTTDISVSTPVAYCDGDRTCTWVKGVPHDEDHPQAYLERAAQQHTRDTGHATEVATEHITRYTPEGDS
jgi:hypothetical protein